MSPQQTTSEENLLTFVDRKKEIALICEGLERIKHKEHLFNFILVFTGIDGIGKTELLNWTERTAKQKNIATCRVDFSGIDFTCKTGTGFFAKSLADAGCIDYDSKTQEFSAIDHSDHVDKILDQLVVFLEKKPLVILLDDTHCIGEVDRNILENILVNIYDEKRLLVVLAGRRGFKWKDPELRDRSTKINLGPLQQEYLREMAPKKYTAISDKVYQITRGYPLASAKAFDFISKFNPSDAERQIKEKEAELIFSLVNNVFIKFLIDRIDEPDRNRIIGLLKIASILRRFDEVILYDLLKNIDNCVIKVNHTVQAQSYIRQMIIYSKAVDWDSAKQAYAVDTSMRWLLEQEMAFNDPKRLETINRFMISWYQLAIKTALERDNSAPHTVIYLLEEIYHQGKLLQGIEENTDLELKAKDRISCIFSGYKRREKNHFYEEYKKDDELKGVLGKTYHSILDFIESINEK